MPKTRIEHTSSFVVSEIDAPARRHRVDVFTKFVLVEFQAETPEWRASTKANRLEDGTHLNPLQAGVFECARTGVRYRTESAPVTV